MSSWIAKITDAGAEALNGLLDCQTLAFIGAKGCAGTVAEDTLTAQTGLDGWTQDADITEAARGTGKVTAKLRFAAADTAYNLKRIGLWVRVGDGEPVMAAISQHTGNGVDIPAKEENPNFSYVHYAGLSIQNGQVVTLTLEPTAEQAARDDAAASAVSAAASALDAANARSAGETARDEAVRAAEQAAADAGTAETVQAALQSRNRVIFGTAADAERLLPGDTLILTDDSLPEGGVDYQDLLLEAQKAAAGEENELETMAVLSAVNATNLRRDAEGLLWTTDTLAEFREKLTAFAAAAVAAGYVDGDGRCAATWAQVQAWFLEGTLLTPLDAEGRDYFWRAEAPKTEYTAIKERLAAIEAMLGEINSELETAVGGEDGMGGDGT